MRGGRNKFGTMYKRDRARRLQAVRVGIGPPPLMGPQTPRHSTSTSNDQVVSSSTHVDYSISESPGYFGGQRCRISTRESYQNGAKAYEHSQVQSPTLSSTLNANESEGHQDPSGYSRRSTINSAGSSPLNPLANTNGTYVPNCDNLAALLSSSIDDPLRPANVANNNAGMYASLYAEVTKPVKSEPFELDPYSHAHMNEYYGLLGDPNFHSHFQPTPESTALRSSLYESPTSHSGPLLPVCPVPTSRAFQSTFASAFTAPTAFISAGLNSSGSFESQQQRLSGLPPFLEKLSRHILEERQWQANLYNLARDLSFMQLDKLDSFAMMCHVVDHSLFAQVDWARNSPYFIDLKV